MTKRIKVLLTVRPVWLLVAAATLAFAVGIFIPTSPTFRGPLFSIENTILIAATVVLGALIAQLYVDRGQMLTRIGKLEDDLRTVRSDNDESRADLTDAASFINRVGLWISKGCKGPVPQPSERLAKHVDTELWAEEVPVGGTD